MIMMAVDADGEHIRQIISDLRGIWKYAALDYHIQCAKNPVPRDIEKANEYAITLRVLWDAFDKYSVEILEKVAMELDGKLIGKGKGDSEGYKAIRTILTEYLQMRLGEIAQYWISSDPR